MKTTVGPLSPSVYWQRRGVVVAVLVLLVVVFSTVFGKSSPATSPTGHAGAASPSPTASPTQIQDGSVNHPYLTSPNATPNPDDSPTPSTAPSGTPSAAASPSPATTPPCADGNLSLVAALTATTWKVGTMPHLQLIVRNITKTPCLRDLGATQQELRIMSGATRLWSSDDCQPREGSDPQVIGPGEAKTFNLVWSGKSSVPKCTAPREQVKAGNYQLFARLGTLMSPPTGFQLT
jgi:hypothetical protein